MKKEKRNRGAGYSLIASINKLRKHAFTTNKKSGGNMKWNTVKRSHFIHSHWRRVTLMCLFWLD